MMKDSIEESEIRKTLRKLAESELPAYQNEQHIGRVPLKFFTTLAQAGFAGLKISEEFGGACANTATIAMVMEELAKVDLGPSIFVGVHTMIGGLIQQFGTPQQHQRYLPKLASGQMLGAFALTEAGAGSDAAAIKTQARKTDNGYELNGEKIYITSAGFADLYVVFARLGQNASGDKRYQGVSVFLVEAGMPGLSFGPPEKKMGCELSPIATVTLEGCKVPRENLLGAEGGGYAIALAGLAGGRVNIAAAANGLSDSAIRLALAHLKQREQFGQALIEFQGLQFMLADMRIKLEAARLLTWQAARLIDENAAVSELRLQSSMAKCFATDSAMQITTDAVQLLGGAGYLRDYQVERLMRDAKMLQIVEGTNQIQRMVIARELAK